MILAVINFILGRAASLGNLFLSMGLNWKPNCGNGKWWRCPSLICRSCFSLINQRCFQEKVFCYFNFLTYIFMQNLNTPNLLPSCPPRNRNPADLGFMFNVESDRRSHCQDTSEIPCWSWWEVCRSTHYFPACNLYYKLIKKEQN